MRYAHRVVIPSLLIFSCLFPVSGDVRRDYMVVLRRTSGGSVRGEQRSLQGLLLRTAGRHGKPRLTPSIIMFLVVMSRNSLTAAHVRATPPERTCDRSDTPEIRGV